MQKEYIEAATFLADLGNSDTALEKITLLSYSVEKESKILTIIINNLIKQTPELDNLNSEEREKFAINIAFMIQTILIVLEKKEYLKIDWNKLNILKEDKNETK